ncbi:MAG TPA: DUF4468 domain-containing protein [Flavobacteriales bacterium]|nr:DUF4468 domain-containing protein [Flavobacteriales bacterium]HMR28297.1 DUF4468 domain-containing protein [Flavobacteriales bacterium]
MKQLLISLALFVSVTAFGQTIPKDEETGKFKYEKVIQAEGLSQADIYDRAKSWVVRTLKSGDNAVNLDDENKEALNATGNIVLNDQVGWLGYTNVFLNFKFNVFVKEGRFKVVIDNFMLSYNVVNTQGQFPRTSTLEEGFKKEGLAKADKQTQAMYEDANEKLTQMLVDIEAAVANGGLEKDNSDW